MDTIDQPLRDRIVRVLSNALEQCQAARAGWEGGSAAFGAVDAYSDIDLNFIVDDECSVDALYDLAESALENISPISMVHEVPPGRYYKLAVGGDFLFVDLCLYRESASEIPLDPDRHGDIRLLFDKGSWTNPKPISQKVFDSVRDARLRDLSKWFVVSQSFVRKAIIRGKQVEAVASYWSYTLNPLSELLRMRFCPIRWDFRGMRYLDRDLPVNVYDEFKELAFVTDLSDLEIKRVAAEQWGVRLLGELASGGSAK
jgi:hypothetical protein